MHYPFSYHHHHNNNNSLQVSIHNKPQAKPLEVVSLHPEVVSLHHTRDQLVVSNIHNLMEQHQDNQDPLSMVSTCTTSGGSSRNYIRILWKKSRRMQTEPEAWSADGNEMMVF